MAHPGLSVLGSYTTNRSFEQVTASLQRKWQECYNVNKTTTRSKGGMTTSRYRETYHPKSRKVNDSLVEMTIQETTEGMVMLSKVPPGGDYIVALDIHRLPGNKTKLMWYSRIGWDESWERNKKWSDGKKWGAKIKTAEIVGQPARPQRGARMRRMTRVLTKGVL